MPHTHSAKKRLRQNIKQRAHNRALKKGIKVQIKKFLAAAKESPADQLSREYNVAAKKLDKAAARRVIHPNTAARKKSQLARVLRDKQAAGKAPGA
jgi:small subunit ribosomal protein S20